MPTQNKVDFTKYVAIGDSITAGYMNGALCYDGQMHNFAYFLSEQFKQVGGGNFHQALVPKQSIGLGFWGNSCLEKKEKVVNENTATEIGYITPQGDFSIVSSNVYEVQQPIQNLGIPASKLTTLVYPSYGNSQNGEGNFNPFYTRIASNPQTSSVLQDAVMQQPTFFTLFAGNNDVLTHALSGCTIQSVTPMQGDVGIGFEATVRAILQALTQHRAKGVVANLPSLKATSFFKTIPYNALVLTHNEAQNLNSIYNSYNLGFNEGKNAFPIVDSLTNKQSVRFIKKEEYILFDVLLDVDKHLYLKGLKPLPKKYILTEAEIISLQQHLDDYNNCLQQLAHEFKIAFVDTNKLLGLRSVDRVYDPKTLNCFYKKNGLFSLDGLHPNAYGHALLANECIQQINNTYACEVPLLNADSYKNYNLNIG